MSLEADPISTDSGSGPTFYTFKDVVIGSLKNRLMHPTAIVLWAALDALRLGKGELCKALAEALSQVLKERRELHPDTDIEVPKASVKEYLKRLLDLLYARSVISENQHKVLMKECILPERPKDIVTIVPIRIQLKDGFGRDSGNWPFPPSSPGR